MSIKYTLLLDRTPAKPVKNKTDKKKRPLVNVVDNKLIRKKQGEGGRELAASTISQKITKASLKMPPLPAKRQSSSNTVLNPQHIEPTSSK